MISTTNQTIMVDDVTDVVVTAAVLDINTGDYVREVRVTAIPAVGTDPTQVFVLRLAAPDRAKLDLSAPAQEF